MEKLNSTGLFSFKQLFADLPAPLQNSTRGTWQAFFVGPAWLRWLAPRGLFLLHFGGWWGKEFSANGTGYNYFDRKGVRIQDFPMKIMETPSILDGKPCLVVKYGTDARFPWRFIQDELRELTDNSLLGMTILSSPGLPIFPLPFLLTRSV